MPLYGVKCRNCGAEESVFRKIAERDVNLPLCWKCSIGMERIISAPFLAPDISPFVSPNGDYISSRAEWKEDLKKHGAIPWEAGIRDDIARNRTAAQERAFEPIAAAVDAHVAALHTAGKLEIT